MRAFVGTVAAAALLAGFAVTAESDTTRAAAVRVAAGSPAVLEMLLGDDGRRLHWRDAPQLIVLLPVMHYDPDGSGTEFVATSEVMSGAEALALAEELTAALAALSAGTLTAFASVQLETPPAGAIVSTMRRGYIVVGRYAGLEHASGTLGLGGRATRPDGTIVAGAILLDAAYDRTSSRRYLLRVHELGHALGYHHVTSAPSIMNAEIGHDLTAVDREAAMLAFGAGQERTPQ